MAIFGDKKENAANRPTGAAEAAAPAANRTVIGAGAFVEGVLKGEGEVVVEGRFKGEVDLAGSFVVAPRGRVEASVKARTVTVEGEIAGNVTAGERVDVRASGVVDGDITTPRVAVAEGATLRGRVNMSGGKPASSSAAPASAAAKG